MAKGWRDVKLEHLQDLYSEVLEKLRTSPKEWRSFLNTASHTYKYSFQDSVMIYAQRPEAIACASFDFWNKRMMRYVKAGTSGIALITNKGNEPRVSYIFDVADTGTMANSEDPYIWKYDPADEERVVGDLQKAFGQKPHACSLEEEIHSLVPLIFDDFWTDNEPEIRRGIEESEGPEHVDARTAEFKNFAMSSIEATALMRSGVKDVSEIEISYPSKPFTTDVFLLSGLSVKGQSERLLRQISKPVRAIENERRKEHGTERSRRSAGRRGPEVRTADRPGLHQNGGLLHSSDNGGGHDAGTPAGPLRNDADGLRGGSQAAAVRPAVTQGRAVETLLQNRGSGERNDGAPDADLPREGGRDGGPQDAGSARVGAPVQRLSDADRRDHQEGADLQLSFFASEKTQKQTVSDGPGPNYPYTFDFSQLDIDYALTHCGLNVFSDSKLRIALLNGRTDYSLEDEIAYLRQEYANAEKPYPVRTSNGITRSVEINSVGFKFIFDYADDRPQKNFVLSWDKVAERISQMVKNNKFLSPDESNTLDGIRKAFADAHMKIPKIPPLCRVPRTPAELPPVLPYSTLPKAHILPDEPGTEKQRAILISRIGLDDLYDNPQREYRVFLADSAAARESYYEGAEVFVDGVRFEIRSVDVDSPSHDMELYSRRFHFGRTMPADEVAFYARQDPRNIVFNNRMILFGKEFDPDLNRVLIGPGGLLQQDATTYNERLRTFAAGMGIPESDLQSAVSEHATNLQNNRIFAVLRLSVDDSKARTYLESAKGKQISQDELDVEIRGALRDFLLVGVLPSETEADAEKVHATLRPYQLGTSFIQQARDDEIAAKLYDMYGDSIHSTSLPSGVSVTYSTAPSGMTLVHNTQPPSVKLYDWTTVARHLRRDFYDELMRGPEEQLLFHRAEAEIPSDRLYRGRPGVRVQPVPRPKEQQPEPPPSKAKSEARTVSQEKNNEQEEGAEEAPSSASQLSFFTQPISQQVIDDALRIGSNHENSRLLICAYFKKDKSPEENARFLQDHYSDRYGENGTGFYVGDQKYAMWYNHDSIRIAEGETVRNEPSAIITWDQAAERIRELLDQGTYLPQNELERVDQFERQELANRLLYLRDDFAEGTAEKGYLPSINAVFFMPRGFQDEVPAVMDLLNQPNSLQTVREELAIFAQAYEEDRSLLRFHNQKPQQLLERLSDLQKEPLQFAVAEGYHPPQRFFISEDEIDNLLRGTQTDAESRRLRLSTYSFYCNHTDHDERVNYVRHLNGDYSGYYGDNVFVTYQSGKGITFGHGNITDPYAQVELTWNAAEKRISMMIDQNRFLREGDREAMPQFEKHQLADDIYSFFSPVSPSMPKPYPADAKVIDAIAGIEKQLDSPDRVNEIYQMMVPVMEATPPGIPLYSSQKKTFDELAAYRDGTFSLFGEHKEPPSQENQPTHFSYRLLSRLQADCDYYLGAGGRAEKHLWAGDAKAQIAKMRELYASLPEKPEWITSEDIDTYARRMIPYQVVVYHATENGFDEMQEYTTLEEAKQVAENYVHGPINGKNVAPYEGAGVYNLDENQWQFITGNFPNEQAIEQTTKAPSEEPPSREPQSQEEPLTQEPLQEASQSSAAPERPAKEPQTENRIEPPQADVSTNETPAFFVPQNYRITDMHLGAGGPKAKFQANLAAIQTLKQIESENRPATPEEQDVLARYTGWGGIQNAFDPDIKEWHNEYAALKSALTDEEYKAAKASVLNAHYTSPTVIAGIYQAIDRFGFTGGHVLEPSCGVGSFFGMLPDSMQKSDLSGVELDSISGRITKALYPNARITIAGFETYPVSGEFDLTIGNVPFDSSKVYADRDYSSYGFSLHNYFFAKGIDELRPGGVLAYVTSHYTLDARGEEARRYLADRANLLGAIRLPNNAFTETANTRVVSDILIFQKKDAIEVPETYPSWVSTGTTEDGHTINQYFIDHPDMVLGDQRLTAQHGRDELTVAPREGVSLVDALAEAVQKLELPTDEFAHPTVFRANVEEQPPAQAQEQTENAPTQGTDQLPVSPRPEDIPKDLPPNSFFEFHDNLWVKQTQGGAALSKLSGRPADRVKGMVEIRDCLHTLLNMQINPDMDDESIGAQRQLLNSMYDSFAEDYGTLSSRANSVLFRDDPSFPLLRSLEKVDDKGNLLEKAAVFTQRTVSPYVPITHTESASDALAVSLSEKAEIDIPYMAALCEKSPEEVINDLKGQLYKDPLNYDPDDPYEGYVTADEYLSGNVRKKLHEAEEIAKDNPSFAENVDALKAVQPEDLGPGEIEVRIGATWVAPHYYEEFMHECFHTPDWATNYGKNKWIEFSSLTSKWSVGNSVSTTFSKEIFGTKRRNAYQIFEDSLNLKPTKIYDHYEDSNGRKISVLNTEETAAAQDKQQAIEQAFEDWIWKDPERTADLVHTYNEEINNLQLREYDGSYLQFPGMNQTIHLRDHQKNAVARILQSGNTLLAHTVGAGKTYTMIAAGMEMKRIGLCKKPMYVVPKHLVEQWATGFLLLYPNANILITTDRDFTTENRQTFCSRIATGDYDAIIIGATQFERIPLSAENQEVFYQKQIDEAEAVAKEAKAKRGNHFTVRQSESVKKRAQSRLDKLREKAEEKKDNTVTFEETGVDFLFVDEAHGYKNLETPTSLSNVAGVPSAGSQKAFDMYMKAQYLNSTTNYHGLVFATGTPVSNAMPELFTMQRFLQPQVLEENHISSLDAWISRSGKIASRFELAPEGTGFRMKTRLADFYNLPELIKMYRLVADVKTADDLDIPGIPDVIRRTISAKPSDEQKAMIQSISERATKIHDRQVSPEEDNMLKITSDGRKLGLDQRLMNPLLPDNPGSKVNLLVDQVYRIWQESTPSKGTQLIFCDLSTPETGKAFHPDPSDEAFHNIYDDIAKKLIRKGIPADEITAIHACRTDTDKERLFEKVRDGTVRILMGSTDKMGTGTNVQERLVAAHHLDCPWRPSDLEQRDGRIVRQGNENKVVQIYTYVTEGTFDSYLWQTVETKQRMISQIMTSKTPARAMASLDETSLSFAEIKAISTGDPRIRERMELDVEVARLRSQKANFQSQHYSLEESVTKDIPRKIKDAEALLERANTDLAFLQSQPAMKSNSKEDFPGIEIDGKQYPEKRAGGEALLSTARHFVGDRAMPIGSYRGFTLRVGFDPLSRQTVLYLNRYMNLRIELGTDALGNITRMNNAINGISATAERVKAEIKSLNDSLTAAKEELAKPFPQEEELREKSARLKQLSAELDLDANKENPAPAQAEEPAPDPPDAGGPVFDRIEVPAAAPMEDRVQVSVPDTVMMDHSPVREIETQTPVQETVEPTPSAGLSPDGREERKGEMADTKNTQVIDKQPSAMDRMSAAVQNAVDNYKEDPAKIADYLQFKSKFHNYSARNTMLIHMANPLAEFCAPYKKWKEMGYQVRKGEHGIPIFAPRPYSYFIVEDPDGTQHKKPVSKATKAEKAKIENGEIEVEEAVYFKTGYVFDISQVDLTEGAVPLIYHLGYTSEQHAQLCDALTKYANALGITVVSSDLHSVSLRGSYSPARNQITLNQFLNDTERLSTLTHEFGHAIACLQNPQETALPVVQSELRADAFSILLQSDLGIPITDTRKEHLQDAATECMKMPNFDLQKALIDISDYYEKTFYKGLLPYLPEPVQMAQEVQQAVQQEEKQEEERTAVIVTTQEPPPGEPVAELLGTMAVTATVMSGALGAASDVMQERQAQAAAAPAAQQETPAEEAAAPAVQPQETASPQPETPAAENTAPPSENRQRVFIDMDGTLTKFNTSATPDMLTQPGYFAALEPQQSMIDAVKELIKNPNLEVYVLSAALDTPTAVNEKNEWLNQHLPEIDKAHRLFPRNGTDKTLAVPRGVRQNDILLDDYSQNLHDWRRAGGVGIKVLNGINNNHHSWLWSQSPLEGAVVSIRDTPAEIAELVIARAAQKVEIAQTQEKILREQNREAARRWREQDAQRRSEIDFVKHGINILDLAEDLGYHVQKNGTQYTLQEHDSCVLYPSNNSFCRFSTAQSTSDGRPVGGSTIDFLLHFDEADNLGHSIHSVGDAINYLKDRYLRHVPIQERMPDPLEGHKILMSTKVFTLPNKAADGKARIYPYLCKTRAIDRDVVTSCMNRNLLYEDERHNAVFVGLDKNQKATFATRHTTLTYSNWKRDVAGSDQKTGWYVDNKSDTLYVTEAPIDAMSVMTIRKQANKSIDDVNYLATTGTGKLNVLMRRMEENPNIKKVVLAFDTDAAGELASGRAVQMIQHKYNDQIKILRYRPPEGKDVNEYLQRRAKRQQEEKAKQHAHEHSRSQTRVPAQSPSM